ncbi:hypothetical protein ABT143_26860 [Streptomyces sp. NPDC002033]|uniref:hypothetical protein n=1 Tax=Streptomyces sp. NPDC002033 TaxID=3154533 RepID=UPI003321630E
MEELKRTRVFPAEWLPLQIHMAGWSVPDETIVRAWPADSLGAVLTAFELAGLGDAADHITEAAAPDSAPTSYPPLVAGMRAAGQDRRLDRC